MKEHILEALRQYLEDAQFKVVKKTVTILDTIIFFLTTSHGTLFKISNTLCFSLNNFILNSIQTFKHTFFFVSATFLGADSREIKTPFISLDLHFRPNLYFFYFSDLFSR